MPGLPLRVPTPKSASTKYEYTAIGDNIFINYSFSDRHCKTLVNYEATIRVIILVSMGQ